jgi:hypothetical protein
MLVRAIPRPLPLVVTVAAALGLAAPLARPRAAGNAAPPPAGSRALTIFYTAETHGTLEPCGCTSDPLGDIARYAKVVRAEGRDQPVLLVDAGGLSYPESRPPKQRAADRVRARFLATELAKLGPFAAGLAETDVGDGASDVVPPRLAVNLSTPAGGASPALAPSLVRVLGGIRVAVFGVADPALADKLHLKAEDPVAAAKREVARLRGLGAELVIALAPLDKPLARRVAREAAPDFVVVGRQVGQGQPRAERAGNAFLVTPAEEMQRVGRIDVVWRGRGPLVDAGSPDAAALRRVEIDKALSRLDEELANWAAHPGGDPAFIESKKKQRADLAAERTSLDKPWTPPAEGSYFSNQLVPLRRSLPRDPAIAAAMKRVDKEIGAINLRAATPPPPPEPGRAYYVGDAKCGGCHKEALAFWKKTVHASAWQTLVEGGKQNDYKCVSCHVTGYGQVGGSSLGHTDRLRDVQCEVCHGPGSTHVKAEGLEEPPAVRTDAPATLCTTCHTEQHSDTFQYEAYLRDIVGPGHGPQRRKKLGDGPTGHVLRSTALARAKEAGKKELEKL